MLYFLKELIILISKIYNADKLLDINNNFGTSIGSMLAYINFEMIMQNKLLYVNKRNIIAKILNIPIKNINNIRNKN